MIVDFATLAAARARDKDALLRILDIHYPQVWRMAVNLTGREELGRSVASSIMRQSVVAAASWDHEEAPTRWYRHHTVLAAREVTPPQPPADDVLVVQGPVDAAYAAFARSLRSLPQQQREAFLLNLGEDFDLRQLGIAMDCSVEAAGLHLRTARKALQDMAGDGFGHFVQLVRESYASSSPDEAVAIPQTRRFVYLGFWTLLGGVLAWIALLTILAAAGAALWWLWPRLVT